MLTRLEVDGFKTFQGLNITFEPFSLVIGGNASGKSNLFDVLQLLSNLAQKDVNESLRGVVRGKPSELFRKTGESRASRMSLAVEVLLNRSVQDSFGSRVELINTRLRYELTLERRVDDRNRERIFVVREHAAAIGAKEDSWAPKVRKATERSAHLLYRVRKNPFLTTINEGGKSSRFSISQDGNQGRNRSERSAVAAAATMLSGITNNEEFPHLFALREELRSWKLLQLDPALLRRTSPGDAADVLEPDGSNLAAALVAIKAETATFEQPSGALALISRQLASLVGEVDGVDANYNDTNKEFTIEFEARDGTSFSSRVASDGTLRILALLAVLHGPQRPGLILFEEPENGIHPIRVKRLVDIVVGTVSRLEDDRNSVPLTQVIVNSHSPIVLDALVERDKERVRVDEDVVLFADTVSILDPATRAQQRKSRFRQVRRGQQDLPLPSDEPPAFVSDFEVLRVLNTVEQSG